MRFVEQVNCEKTKNHQADKPGNSYKPQGRMYEHPGDEYCPVKAYEIYLSKINSDCEWLWQRPNMTFNLTGNWYHKIPVGKQTLGNFL